MLRLRLERELESRDENGPFGVRTGALSMVPFCPELILAMT